MAEKKSTRKVKSPLRKRVDKKVEELIPMSELQHTVEPTRKINWDAVRFSWTAITLLGAGFLFMVGWAYVSSWYSYFGVNIDLLNIPLQQFLIYSAPAVFLTITFLLLSFGMYYVLKFLVIGRFPHYITDAYLSASINDWIGIMLIYLLASMLVFYTVPLGLDTGTKLMTIGYLRGFAITVFILAIVVAALSFAHRTYALQPIIEPFYQQIMSVLSSGWVLVFPSMIVLFSTMSMSARLAINYAHRGENWVTGSKIQRVTLISPQPLNFLKELEISCDTTNHCMYGPFGLIADSQLSFYLVNWWKLDSVVRFPQNPGLYIIPRNDPGGAYFVVLDSIAKLTATPQPTQTPTFTPTATILAPISTSTPDQP
jgi:hypothetical protein